VSFSLAGVSPPGYGQGVPGLLDALLCWLCLGDACAVAIVEDPADNFLQPQLPRDAAHCPAGSSTWISSSKIPEPGQEDDFSDV